MNKFENMKKDELLQYCTDNNIKAFKSWNKSKIISAIKELLTTKEEDQNITYEETKEENKINDLSYEDIKENNNYYVNVSIDKKLLLDELKEKNINIDDIKKCNFKYLLGDLGNCQKIDIYFKDGFQTCIWIADYKKFLNDNYLYSRKNIDNINDDTFQGEKILADNTLKSYLTFKPLYYILSSKNICDDNFNKVNNLINTIENKIKKGDMFLYKVQQNILSGLKHGEYNGTIEKVNKIYGTNINNIDVYNSVVNNISYSYKIG